MALSIEHERFLVPVLSLLFILYVFTVKRIKPLPAGGRFFFLLIEGGELSFGLMLLETTKASRVFTCSFSAFGLHDLKQSSLKAAHAKYHRNHILVTY